MQVEPEGGCFRDPAGRFLCASTQCPRGCLAQDAAETGQASLPPPCSPLCLVTSLLQAGEQLPCQHQVPGHCHHGYLLIHCTSHTAVPSPAAWTSRSSSPICPGSAGAGGGRMHWGKPLTETCSQWQAGSGSCARNRRALGPIHTTNTERGGRLQPMKKLWRDRKRTA